MTAKYIDEARKRGGSPTAFDENTALGLELPLKLTK